MCVQKWLALTSRQARTCELASEHRFAVPTPARGAAQAQGQPLRSTRRCVRLSMALQLAMRGVLVESFPAGRPRSLPCKGIEHYSRFLQHETVERPPASEVLEL